MATLDEELALRRAELQADFRSFGDHGAEIRENLIAVTTDGPVVEVPKVEEGNELLEGFDGQTEQHRAE
ncbi:hypothetical protein RvY_06107 [Ramazzottius varieornatus]|uniref:Uncharacterized protein n=1 Tax=Ramazzottius varieornatus TaxID=947166 RepID=A0A1D1V2X0_RAMVA|nr:hypothetical protein RvY_06107 [Ramazzottius varieornatus]